MKLIQINVGYFEKISHVQWFIPKTFTLHYIIAYICVLSDRERLFRILVYMSTSEKLLFIFVSNSDFSEIKRMNESFKSPQFYSSGWATKHFAPLLIFLYFPSVGSFRGDYLNVLIATNIVEEGIDIPNCGLVIMFDEIKSYRSYVQSKGRARMQFSKYIVLNDVPRETFLARLRGYREVEMLLNKVSFLVLHTIHFSSIFCNKRWLMYKCIGYSRKRH